MLISETNYKDTYYKDFEKIEIEPYNMPPKKRYAMGEPICPVLIEFKMYRFFEPTEEEKKQRIVTTAVVDFTGGKLDDENKVIRLENIKYYAKVDNPTLLKEYQNVHITHPDLDGIVDEEQQDKLIRLLYRLYCSFYLKCIRDRITFSPKALLMRSDIY